AIAFCAYWKGLLYSRAALDGARAVADRLKTAGTPEDRHLEAARHGLAAIFGGFEATDMARDLVTLARLGLREQGEELEYLRPLEELVASGRSPAAALLNAWLRDPSPTNILPRIRW
ncbi:MAG TPA: glutamate--cysteine ligase, partial [Myxococcota bacterium]|nr:glutamate--cysteine ligase [Myxococcota bacterium]